MLLTRWLLGYPDSHGEIVGESTYSQPRTAVVMRRGHSGNMTAATDDGEDHVSLRRVLRR